MSARTHPKLDTQSTSRGENDNRMSLPLSPRRPRMTATICSCPIETTAHHPSCVHAVLLSDVGAFELSNAAQSVTTDVRARAMREPS